MDKNKTTANAVETNPLSLSELKIKFADLVRLRNKYAIAMNQMDAQLQAIDAEITKQETPTNSGGK